MHPVPETQGASPRPVPRFPLSNHLPTRSRPPRAPAAPAIALTRKGERYCAANLPTRDPSGAITAAEVDRLRAAAAELARIREEAGDALDRILATLDAIDGDPDLEPSLGAVEWWPDGAQVYRSTGRSSGIADADDGGDQRRWAAGAGDDDREAGDDNGIADFDAFSDPVMMTGLTLSGGDFRGDGVAEARRMLAAFREARA